MLLFHTLLALLRAFFQARSQMALENLTLRHQLLVFQRSVKRPQLKRSDRILWVLLSRLWKN